MRISIIAAVSENGVIGRDQALPWHLPKDLKFFMQMTRGHHLLMGRKTYESVGQPLRDRTTVVVTRQSDFRPAGVLVADSIESALKLVESTAETELFVAGGSEIYRLALPISDRLYLTRIHAEVDGDTYFPEFSLENWKLTSREDHPADNRHAFAFSFLVYDRICRPD